MERAQRIDALDGIRCFAVLLAIGFHVTILWPSVPTSIVPIKDGGFIGVDIFFVLSGFLISGLLIDEFSRTGGIRYLRFFARRVLRLLPPLVICIALTLAWASKQGEDLREYVKPLVAALLNFYNWLVVYGEIGPPQIGHLWSLSVEEQLYILLALIFVVISIIKKQERLFLVLAIVSFLLISWSFVSRHSLVSHGAVWERLYFATDHRFGEFFCGVLTQIYRLKHCERQTTFSKIITYPALVFLLIYSTRIELGNFFHYPVGSLLTSIATASVILASTYEGSLASRFFSLRFFSSIGKISYSMYLVHVPVFYAMSSLAFSGKDKLAVAMSFIFLYSIAVYFAVEKPLGKFRQKFLSA
jgi:peptidoglycan/LPS O-acetylase OafA/YrhL